MENKSFWLLDINTSVLSVSLVDNNNNAFIISAVGPRVPFNLERESIVSAVDSSLTEAAKSADISDDQEPNTVALILPPLWIGSDGKIVPQCLKLIENICRDLDFKPMGFIANDEAIVEDTNHIEGFPASFVLVNLSEKEMFVSLTYLGKVIERISKPLTSTFNPSILESALIEFKTESTLPPQIIVFGDISDSTIDSIRNFSWVGKKNIETFLHFPDIKKYDSSEISQIYTRAITSQFQSTTSAPDPSPPVASEEVEDVEETEIIPEANTTVSPQDAPLTEVTASDLGFSDTSEESAFPSDSLTIPETIPEVVSEAQTITQPPRHQLKIKLPTFPKIHFPSFNFLLIIPVLLPLLILIPFLFSRAEITIHLTPYIFNKQITVTLNPLATSVDLSKNVIPVIRQSFDITTSASIATTGQKTIGNKAIGEVVIYNQSNSPRQLPQAAILIDSQGNNYTLTNSATIAPSSTNLDLGVITLGQTKASISAVVIGPEYNLAQNTQLHFKDYPETILVAKVSVALSGGSKSQVGAVSAVDKNNLEKKITSDITIATNNKISQNINNIPGLINNAIQIVKGRIDYNREIGEETDTLSASATSTIYVFSLTPENKTILITDLVANNSDLGNLAINSKNFNLSFSPSNNNIDSFKGLLTIDGSSTPQVDIPKVSQMISGKSLNTARKLIQDNVPRVYNFEITTNFPFLKSINPLPFRLSNITIDVK